jgi:hypothetical protein
MATGTRYRKEVFLDQTTEQPSASGSPAAPASGSYEVLPGVMGSPPSSEPAPEPAPAETQGGGGGTAADAVAAETQPNPAEPVPAAPSKFKLGEVEFDSPEAAAHSFKTLRGMHRALERRSEQARLQLVEEQTRRLQLEQRLAALETQRETPQKGPNGQPAGDQPDQDAPGNPDWTVFQMLFEKHGLPTAMAWLQQANNDSLESRLTNAVGELERRLEDKFAPLQETYAEQLEERTGVQLFQTMANYRDQAGREAYPELKDPAAMAKIGLIAKRLKLPREYLLSPQGIHVATAVYRDALAIQAAGVGSSASTTTSQAPASPAAAAAAVGNGADAPVPSRAPVPQSEQERIRAEIMAAAVSTNELGFS